MTRRSSGSRGRGSNRRKLDKKNVRRQSKPQGKEAKIKAIGDDLEGEIRSYLPMIIMMSEMNQRDLAEVMGTGGPSLELFVEEFESGYANATGESKSEPYDLDKEQAPDLKLDSREAIMPWGAGDDANFDSKPDKSSAKKPPKKKPRRK